jgi:hypothetical protein
MNRLSPAAALLALLAALPATACAHRADAGPVAVEIHDRRTGATLPVRRAAGRSWIVGEPGHEYSIRLRNRTGERVLAVVSVDGVNAITGETASPGQSGYVLEPWQTTEVEGWRKSLDRVAAFYFTSLGDAYATRTGRPNDVGVIGVAVFRERPAPVVDAPPPYEPPSVYTPPPAAARDRLGELDAPAPATAQAPAAAPPQEAADGATVSGAPAARESRRAAAPGPRLGTGHGRRLDSRVDWTTFERATDAPAQVVAIRYDSRRNLVALGVLPPERQARRDPNPFPAGFAPDP